MCRIKKAYRRKALELHPDRNFGKEEEATQLFAEIQTAYDILSDPHERAWYDSHESAILRGADGGEEHHYDHNVRMTTAEDITLMLRKFHGKVDYSDSPTGFFGFLRDTFDKLANEEQLAADWENLDVPDYPPFGHKDDNYEDVVKEFYAGWSGFSTKKSFSWKDVYRYSEAPDRRVRRMMEKENKRLRDEGRREFNDAVRALLAFVRKRDPRYTPNTQSDAERQQAMREAAKAQAARARAANAAMMTQEVPEWTKSREPEDVEESEEEELEEVEFECVACRKIFKSERQFEVHEKSKKHQKAVQALRRKMREDDRNFRLSEDLTTPSADDDEPQDDHQIWSDADDTAEAVRKLDLEDDRADELSDRRSEDAKPVDANDEAEPSTEAPSDDGDSDHTPTSKVESRPPDTSHVDTEGDGGNNTERASMEKKMGKAAQKRAKKAAQKAAVEETDFTHKCAYCNATFPSRTRLFQHINDFGHAAPVPKGAKGTKGKGRR